MKQSNSVSLRIQSERGKIRTRKSSVSGHFSRSVGYGFQVVHIGAQSNFRYGEVLNEFSKKLCFILNEEYYQYFLPDMTGISLWFEQAVRRFTIVNLNKAAKLSIPSLIRVSIQKFPLWHLWLIGQHYAETILIPDESRSCFLDRK